jgi:hypothetical protein
MMLAVGQTGSEQQVRSRRSRVSDTGCRRYRVPQVQGQRGDTGSGWRRYREKGYHCGKGQSRKTTKVSEVCHSRAEGPLGWGGGGVEGVINPRDEDGASRPNRDRSLPRPHASYTVTSLHSLYGSELAGG